MKLIFIIILFYTLTACTKQNESHEEVHASADESEQELLDTAKRALTLREAELDQMQQAGQQVKESALETEALKKAQELERQLQSDATKKNKRMMSETKRTGATSGGKEH